MNCHKHRLLRAGAAVIGVAFMLATGACGPTPDDRPATPAASAEKAAVLYVDLQDGFSKDAVEIRLGDETIYRRDDVSTDMRISRADAVEAELGGSKPMLTVRLPGRQIEESLSLENLEAPIYIGVSVIDGAIRFKVSEQPFGYM